MKNKIAFFENIQKLKKEREIWLWYGVKEPETVAGHSFRVAFLVWLLAGKKKLNKGGVLKMALAHDFCQVFQPDELLGKPLLSGRTNSFKDRAKAKEIVKKLLHLSLAQKKERARRKTQRRERAFQKFMAGLPENYKKELEGIWQDFKRGASPEVRFVVQAERAENFLQAFEYWARGEEIPIEDWLYWAEMVFDDPLFIEFKGAVVRRFLRKAEGKDEMGRIVDFLVRVGRLKSQQRVKWVLRKVNQPEKTADHCFSEAVAAWFFAKDSRLKLNSEKAIKIALAHELAGVFLKEKFSYHYLFPNLRGEIVNLLKKPALFSAKEREEILREVKKKVFVWPFFSARRKRVDFAKAFRRERSAVRKITSLLPQPLGREIFAYWERFGKGLDKEAKFVQQVDVIDNLLQAVAYHQKSDNFPLASWWNELGEKIEDAPLLIFVESLRRKVCLPR